MPVSHSDGGVASLFLIRSKGSLAFFLPVTVKEKWKGAWLQKKVRSLFMSITVKEAWLLDMSVTVKEVWPDYMLAT